MIFTRLSSLMAIISLALQFNSTAKAQDAVSFGGKEFNLSANTILLDREDLYGNPKAIKDPLEAFRKINEIGTEATLLVAPSVYWLDDPDDPEIKIGKGREPFGVEIKCNNLKIIGLANNPEDVVFAVNRGQTQGAVGNFTMIHFEGEYFETGNITYGNYCNADLIYPRNPELNREKRKSAIVQAQICICQNTDKVFAYNCQFISRLNLCPFMNAKHILFDHCYFESTDDALPGGAVYKDCRFTFFSSKPFYTTDETGAVFYNCDIRSLCNGPQYFTKVPGMVTAVDTRFSADHPVTLQWTRDASDIISYQNNISLNGTKTVIDSDRRELGPDLDQAPVKDAYVVDIDGRRIYNLPNILGGNDGWDPLNYGPSIKEAESKLGRKLTGIPVKLRLTSNKTTLEPKGDTAIITVQPLLWGGYPSGSPSEITFISDNVTPQPQVKIISSKLEEGPQGRISLNIKPFLQKAPKFKKKPVIRHDKTSGLYTVDYSLAGNGENASTVMWGRMENLDGQRKAILLRSFSAEEDCSYSPVSADMGEEIFAVVVPKFSDSRQGVAESATPVKVDISSALLKPESNLSTDFHDIPIVRRKPGLIGAWTFDVFKPLDTYAADWTAVEEAGWYYGKGFDASLGVGINQNAKGARMTYIPMREHTGNMHAKVIVEPAKNGGQGFGSATSQYMDICIKFDPVSLTGYALRIERTPEHDRAVQFSLVEYNNGKTSILNKGLISNAYRTTCTINVAMENGVLRATATTDAPEATLCCDEVVNTVDIASSVKDNSFGGFAVQHTGSWGPSSTLIRSVELDWD